ncbi:hypothetical protein BHE74_00008466 [Ensete ventricosum]|nr:hypothetical protein GW17_00037324 [Ensete ventricosum]RWW83043.1 hypothetical protein BHE74_00008466 [Ensete ventricosum]
MGRQLGWETWREYTEESKEAGRGGRREEDVEGVSIVSTTNLRIIRELLFGRPQILEVKIFEVETAPTHLHVCREHVLTSMQKDKRKRTGDKGGENATVAAQEEKSTRRPLKVSDRQ